MRILRSIGITALLIGLFAVTSIQAQEAPLQVVATYSILGDLVQNVAGDNINLTVLVGPDGDSHVYEPTPQDAIRLAEADIIFENGLEFEMWIDDLYTSSGSTATRVVVSDGIEPLEFAEGEHENEHEHDAEAAMTLDSWAGEYISVSAMGIDALQVGWDAVLASTPELTMDDVASYWELTTQTSFDALTFDGQNVTFTDADGITTCAYTLVEMSSMEAMEGVTAAIFETTDAACADTYQYLLLNPIHAAEAGAIPHFHMSYGSADLGAFIEESAVFSPALYPAGTTADALIPFYETNARMFSLFMAETLGKEIELTEEEQSMMQDREATAEGDEHDHGEFDPHIWHDPNNVMVMVENIRTALVLSLIHI